MPASLASALAALPNVSSVERVAGADRYATSRAVLAYGASRGLWGTTAMVLSGAAFARSSRVVRLAVPDRYSTCVAVAAYGASLSDGDGSPAFSYRRVVVVTGRAFADAVALGVSASFEASGSDSSGGFQGRPVVLMADGGNVSQILSRLGIEARAARGEEPLRIGAIEVVGREQPDLVELVDGLVPEEWQDYPPL